MAADLTTLRNQLNTPERITADPFGISRQLAALVNGDSQTPDADPQVQELILRALEWRAAFGSAIPIIDALARQRGLYPYLQPEDLTVTDLLAYELHRPANLDEIVFHRAQAEVYRLLMDGTNVILSAPTSFGKSIIVDAIIAGGQHRNVAIVVPTIALIDETRRRLTARFKDQFKIITHIGQQLGDRNILILTQERAVEMPDLPKVDFFVIDEFYKLDPRRDAERSMTLNQAFYRLWRQGGQFYLLGPNIRQLPIELPERLRCVIIATDFATVVSEIHRVHTTDADRLDRLVEVCRGLEQPTLIYCASPASARRVAEALVSSGISTGSEELDSAATWVASEYHPDWVFVRALRHGIGLHHGKVPRALQQYIVRTFNNEHLRFLVCTSTLIEGVNTKAKNVVVYDNRVSTKRFDFFTFNNIKGRSGRMFEHFVGRVFLFNDAPQEELPLVDVPVVTQADSVPESLLIQLEDRDLSERSRERLGDLRRQEVLNIEVLRANHGIEPSLQIGLAEELQSDILRYHQRISWSGMPSYEQLEAICQLIWNFLLPDNRRRAGISSGSQLAFKINRYRNSQSARRLILEELSRQDEPDADAAVEEVLEFIRQWATFHFPRYLMAVDRIQRHVFGRAKLPPGDYSPFAARIENYFVAPGIAALDEYGVPLQIARKIAPYLGSPTTLDEALAGLRTVDVSRLPLSTFERGLVTDASNHV